MEFSPIHHRELPPSINGLYLGGGYPEIHAAQLSENQAMMQAIRRFAEAGASTPTTAKALSDVGCRESGAFRGLVARGVFIECEPGKYFVDEQRAVAFKQRRRKQAVIGIF